MRILVTGGAGFIGGHLCERLLADGHEVICIDNLDTGRLANLTRAMSYPNFSYMSADVRDGFSVELQVDRIYNLACPASPKHYRRDPIGTLRTSILGMINCLELAQATGARVLQASTSEIYGDPTVHPQRETYVGSVNCFGPRACYDEGKRAAETACYDYHHERGVQVRIARLFNVYGPRMAAGDGRVVPNFVMQCLTGTPITMYGAGSQTRSFCFVDDMVEGLIRLMEAPGGLVGPVNLGNPNEFTIRELADILIAKTNSKSVLRFEELPEDDPRLRRPDISKAMELLDWQPTISLDEGIDITIAWFRAEIEAHARTLPARSAPGQKVVGIIGGGPAGLTAAYELLKHSDDHQAVVFEGSDKVGGISRTEIYKGNRFDIGGHRFITKVKAVEALWHEVLPEEFDEHRRLSRIYYRGRFFAYPLKLFNALINMGAYESARILISYVKWKLRPYSEETNFEQWVTNRFGGRLFWHFFRSYSEKIWGRDGKNIQAEWAVQRIKNMSLRKAVWGAIAGAGETAAPLDKFNYPRLGPGMMWEAFRDRILDGGGEVRMQSAVTRLFRDEQSVLALEIETPEGAGKIAYRFEADQFISSMPISTLVLAMSPPAPPVIRAAAERLKYRDLLIVALVLDGPEPFPDNWLYIHSPAVKVGRIQNFRAWSEDMVADPNTSTIGMEYFCQEGDELWSMDDRALKELALRELRRLGLDGQASVLDGTVIRQPKAYPVYDEEYRESLDLIRGWLTNFSNLQVVGRNGMHHYNNQDHSMLTAMLAVQNILGAEHNLWNVDVEKDNHDDLDGPGDSGRMHRLTTNARSQTRIPASTEA